MAEDERAREPDGQADRSAGTSYIVFDTESVVDGALLSRVLYPGESLTPEAAVAREREARLEESDGSSDFISVTFHVPVAISVARVGRDFRLLDLVALDAPRFDPCRMVSLFWKGIERYAGAALVDFNGRGFDIPLLTLSAFRFGISCPRYFKDPDRFGFRYRFTPSHIDLMEWLTEYGAYRMKGGLNLLAKMLGKPGKMTTRGDQVDELYRKEARQEISDYCCHDVLDTYFIFLRTRVMTGELALEEEGRIVAWTRKWLEERAKATQPGLRSYLECFGNWDPKPFL
jgi:predicted PolB exonuclease-like 3'-5' exonuclease